MQSGQAAPENNAKEKDPEGEGGLKRSTAAGSFWLSNKDGYFSFSSDSNSLRVSQVETVLTTLFLPSLSDHSS